MGRRDEVAEAVAEKDEEAVGGLVRQLGPELLAEGLCVEPKADVVQLVACPGGALGETPPEKAPFPRQDQHKTAFQGEAIPGKLVKKKLHTSNFMSFHSKSLVQVVIWGAGGVKEHTHI